MFRSFRVRLWAIYNCCDFPFSSVVPLAYGATIDPTGGIVGTEEAWTIARLLVIAWFVKTVLWTLLMVALLKPTDHYLAKRERGEPVSDAELLRAGVATYTYSSRFFVPYALMWAGQYLALYLYADELPHVKSAGAGTLIFSGALFLAALVLNVSINGFLTAPIAGRISLDAQERKLEIPAPPSSFRRLLIVITLFLTLAPVGWMGSAGPPSSTSHMFPAR